MIKSNTKKNSNSLCTVSKQQGVCCFHLLVNTLQMHRDILDYFKKGID